MENITNPEISEFINSYYKPINEELGHIRDYAEENHIPIISKETEMMLLQILRYGQPKRILEIGTCIGYSAACFAAACESSRILTVEKNKDLFEKAVELLEDLGLTERVHIFLGDGEEVMERLVYKTNIEGLDHFDFIFIDASKSHYLRFWEVAEKLVKDGGMIVCDNTLMNGRTVDDKYDRLDKHKTNIVQMRDFVDYICKLPHVTTALLPVGDGLSISIVSKSK